MPESKNKMAFIFLDTDKHASPFDILLTMDLFPEAEIIKYEDVTGEDTEKIVQDAIFARGPEGTKHTKLFINGRDFKKANEILDKAKHSMIPPFEVSVIIDPRGAYTTAAAAVAKTLELSVAKQLGTLENKVVTVLAGTGPVGQTAAKLYASEKAEVILTSRSLQKATSIVTRINEEFDIERVRGVEAQTAEDMGEVIENADVVLSAGTAATELLPLQILKRHSKKCRIVADINAVPPFGVEGLESDSFGKEILPNVYSIGAQVINKLKQKVEAGLIMKAVEEPSGVFDYRTAYDIAKKTIVSQKEAEKQSQLS
jgi:methylene-tetrahydromethanopterin dehydrogenase